ncbi:MAG: hypothetical protein FWD11_11430, partial [Micrococcales bacterium]|nr:hypothetical protein [Micrococcales bacterium]
MADTMIAGRYRVDKVLPDDIPGATTSRATDTILGRSVLIRLLPADRPALLDAARRAALVTDARLARVLDVGTLPDGRGYVINEQVTGTSLSSMLQRGPVASNVARSVAGETASAIDVARRRGVHHLALRPSVIHVAADGRVVLTGLALDAALLDLRLADVEATRCDTEDLVRLLYTALTGQWPSRPGEPVTPDLAKAPTEGAGWAAPSAVAPRAGIPDDLDRLCRTLSTGHALATPADVVQALEPWAQIRVQSSADMATVVQRSPIAPRPTEPAPTPPVVAAAPAVPPPIPATTPPPVPAAPVTGFGEPVASAPVTPVRGVPPVEQAAPAPARPAGPIPAGPIPAGPVPGAAPVPAGAPVPVAAPAVPSAPVDQPAPAPTVAPEAPVRASAPAPAVAPMAPVTPPRATARVAPPVAPSVRAPVAQPAPPAPAPVVPVAQPAPVPTPVPAATPAPVASPAAADEHQSMLPPKNAPVTQIAPPPGAILPFGDDRPPQPTAAEWLGQAPAVDPPQVSSAPPPAPQWVQDAPEPPMSPPSMAPQAAAGPSWLAQLDAPAPPAQRWTGAGGPSVAGPHD